MKYLFLLGFLISQVAVAATGSGNVSDTFTVGGTGVTPLLTIPRSSLIGPSAGPTGGYAGQGTFTITCAAPGGATGHFFGCIKDGVPYVVISGNTAHCVQLAYASSSGSSPQFQFVSSTASITTTGTGDASLGANPLYESTAAGTFLETGSGSGSVFLGDSFIRNFSGFYNTGSAAKVYVGVQTSNGPDWTIKASCLETSP